MFYVDFLFEKVLIKILAHPRELMSLIQRVLLIKVILTNFEPWVIHI